MPLRFPRPRFSLLTLLLSVLLLGSLATLWWNWQPWALEHTLRGHGNIVYTAVFSPDGRRIVTASNDNTARVWDAQTGAELAVLKGHEGSVHSAAFSPDGRRI